MISEPAIREILALYDKHGWTLHRVLLSVELKSALSGKYEGLFGMAAVFISELDALWFSRSSRPESEAWEIRHLSETPFALVEVVSRDMSDGQRNEALKSAEIKMAEIVKIEKTRLNIECKLQFVFSLTQEHAEACTLNEERLTRFAFKEQT